MPTAEASGNYSKITIGITLLYQICIFNQASIPAHAQLGRVLSCITHMGFMERMHAYKDAVAKGKGKEFGVGTFNYPILMAGDIVLYDAPRIFSVLSK